MHALVRFSELVLENPRIEQIDINPLLVGEQGLMALDARVVLHSPDRSEEALPAPAIRPYPHQYVHDWELPGGSPVRIRPIRPDDEPLMVAFHETVSDQSVYWRYFIPMKLSRRIAHERLSRMCFIDYDRELALVVETRAEGPQQILGVGRLCKVHGTDTGEFSILISDAYQRRGLGTRLLSDLIDAARSEKLGRIVGHMLPDNRGMQSLCEALGFALEERLKDGDVEAVLSL